MKPYEREAIFKFVEERSFATDMLQGRFWISTYRSCRVAEGVGRADPGEGSNVYRIDALHGDSSDPAFAEIARRGGFDLKDTEDVYIEDAERTKRVDDAFLYCCTYRHDLQDFGPYRVVINKPQLFFDLLTRALGRRENWDQVRAGIRDVIYGERTYKGLEKAPSPYYLKPPEPYAPQCEVRLLWVPAVPLQAYLQPGLVECPEAAALCQFE